MGIGANSVALRIEDEDNSIGAPRAMLDERDTTHTRGIDVDEAVLKVDARLEVDSCFSANKGMRGGSFRDGGIEYLPGVFTGFKGTIRAAHRSFV